MERASVLARFSSATREWFQASFDAPTPAQVGAWEAATEGRNALVVAPTGSGKTLAGFLWSIDKLASAGPVEKSRRLRVLYISPLKALAVDIERNLRSPLAGIKGAAVRSGIAPPEIAVGVRTGDTPAEDRRRFRTSPPDILITTPESLFLLLTSQARDALRGIETVIIDEVHAVAATKRGSHLALSLERLDALLDRPAQRLGLSATVRPLDEMARFIGGARPVDVIDPGSDKRFDLRIVVPMEDMSAPGEETGDILSGSAAGAEARTSIWPHVEEKLLEVIRAHSSTIVFVNARRLAERLCSRLNELAGDEIARAHHGSVSREQRLLIEEELKAGRLPAVVATSSLELGIDMGAVDLVVQVEAPDSVASGLQRVGRAGHHVGAVSRGLFFPKFRGDLLESAVVVERMKRGEIEELAYPRNALDVLAQQVVAMVAMDDWKVDEIEGIIKRAAPYADLPRSALESVLDMLSGRYPSDEFAELRPRLNWDRTTDVLSGRQSAQRLAVTSGGTIPDRGLYGVFIAGDRGTRVGELDEEMVYESRPGDTFVLGSSTWLIEDITADRVLVTPAPGQPGKMPFWHGDAPGRPAELGRALGAFVRELMAVDAGERADRLRQSGLDEFATNNLLAYLDEQKDATGALPDDRTLIVERFRDELGDWRLCIHSPFGARLHAPWSQAIEARVRSRLGIDVQCIYTDDGIVVRWPEVEDVPATDLLFFDAEDIEDVVVEEAGNSALFASRFRECSARALLLPKRRPGTRTPLWQQRRRSAHLLQVARKYGSFPIVLETYRECLQDVFDLPGLKELMSSIARREVRVVEIETPFPSPYASALQFGYVSAFLYEGDSPLAERRAQALSLDRSLLAEIMGHEELRELVDEDALTHLELDLQLLSEDRKIAHADALHDALRNLGDLSYDEICARSRQPDGVAAWLDELTATRRALEVRVAGDARWIAIEDAARYRDALGVALPMGVPSAFLDPVPDPLADLAARYARRHGPFHAADVAERLGLGVAVVEQTLKRLDIDGRVVDGEFRPGASGAEWIDIEVLRRLRRASLASFRREVEPVPPEALARFALAWHRAGPYRPRSSDASALLDVVEQLQGAPLAASTLERAVLPARLGDYDPSTLDQLCASGEVVWAGAGALGSDDGWIHLALAESAPLLLPDPSDAGLSETARQVRAALESKGASFFRQIGQEIGSSDDTELLLSLWELVWAGVATNDTLAPVRAVIAGSRSARRRSGRRRPTMPTRVGPPSGAGRWSLTPEREKNATRKLHAQAEQLLQRHGVLTRGAMSSERVQGGFAALYPILKAMEESGRCRRGYFVEGLGGAQFAFGAAVDRMRSFVDDAGPLVEVLAATDPANPYGAALPWPGREIESGHRAGRKAGALVVLVDGALALYLEKGGRSLLSFSDDEDVLDRGVAELGSVAASGRLGRLSLERADGVPVQESRFAEVLVRAGFRVTSRGLRVDA